MKEITGVKVEENLEDEEEEQEDEDIFSFWGNNEIKIGMKEDEEDEQGECK